MSAGIDVVFVVARVRDSDEGIEDVFAGFLPLNVPFSVVFLKFVIVDWEVSERESSTRGRAGGIVNALAPRDEQTVAESPCVID